VLQVSYHTIPKPLGGVRRVQAVSMFFPLLVAFKTVQTLPILTPAIKKFPGSGYGLGAEAGGLALALFAGGSHCRLKRVLLQTAETARARHPAGRLLLDA